MTSQGTVADQQFALRRLMRVHCVCTERKKRLKSVSIVTGHYFACRTNVCFASVFNLIAISQRLLWNTLKLTYIDFECFPLYSFVRSKTAKYCKV